MRSEEEIRDLVTRIVDQAVSERPVASSTSDASPVASSPSTTGIAIGADHGGFALKQQLLVHLRDRGYQVTDCGTDGTGAVDYPDFAHAVAKLVASGRCDTGVIVDGAGIGSSMVANKVPGVRAALCYDLSSARNSREHNHANVLTLGAGLIGQNLARQILDTWLGTPWGGARHARRVAKIDEIERAYSTNRE
jgi:ribose 5-phosphate isomerase B